MKREDTTAFGPKADPIRPTENWSGYWVAAGVAPLRLGRSTLRESLGIDLGRLLDKTANCFRTGQLSILAPHPSIQSGKLGRL